jgi:serine/threonine protein kinase
MIGQVICHYRIKLGVRAMGVVYRAGDLKMGSPLALKLLSDEMARDRAGAGRFEREVHARSIVHRDVKPANLFLTSRGYAKLLDFGVAAGRRSCSGGPGGTDASTIDLLTTPGTGAGTPGFRSPEQVRGDHIDARSPSACPNWSGDGRVLYCSTPGRNASFGTGSPPDCHLLSTRDTGAIQIYALDWEQP